MSQYDKIWIEVDVSPAMSKQEKTTKLQALMEALNKLDCIENITAIDYIADGECKKRELDMSK